MVFGNLDGASGTGVVFTRHPATGADGPYGDFRDERGEVLFRAGDLITIDGATGEVWLGAAAEGSAVGSEDDVLARDLPELAALARRHQPGVGAVPVRARGAYVAGP
jgi:hypothetical protein